MPTFIPATHPDWHVKYVHSRPSPTYMKLVFVYTFSTLTFTVHYFYDGPQSRVIYYHTNASCQFKAQRKTLLSGPCLRQRHIDVTMIFLCAVYCCIPNEFVTTVSQTISYKRTVSPNLISIISPEAFILFYTSN